MTSTIVGREGEVAVIDAVLDTIRREPVAGGVCICGRSGIGKTTLLTDIERRASVDGWLVLRTACHQIQTQMPLVTVKRLVRAVAERLGDEASRYSLEGADSAEEVDAEHAFYRILEGLLVDYSVLLAIDDVQWIDAESERVVSQALRVHASSPLALVAAGRGEAAVFDGLELTFLALDPLTDEATDGIVRNIVPSASDDVVKAIIAHAAGSPLTASVLANEVRSAKISGAEDVPASMRAVVARLVTQMKPRQREFLQLCSLIDDPIEYRVIRNLYESDADVDELIGASVPSFLTFDGRMLRFAHASVAEGVRQTIPVDVPFRRRVLHALLDLDAPTLGDRERIVRQAAACGDRVLERSALLDLARAAMREGARLTACEGYRRANAIEQPADDDFVREYLEFGTALIASDLYVEAHDTLDSAVKRAFQRGIRDGLGELAALLMISSWYADLRGAIWAVFERYIEFAETSNDRAALLSAASLFYAYAGDVDAVRNCKNSVLVLPGEVDTKWLFRVFQAEGLAELYVGRYEEARSALLAASTRVDDSRPDGMFLLETTRLFVELAEFGVGGLLERLPVLDSVMPPGHVSQYRNLLEAFALVARGDFGEASLFVERGVMRGGSFQTLSRILSIDAAIAVLGRRPLQYQSLVESQILSLTNRVGDSAIALASWWISFAADTHPAESRRIADAILPRIREGLDPSALYLPESLALYAVRTRDADLLREIADRDVAESQTRWNRAHQNLAKAIACRALERTGAGERLASTATELSLLGATAFSALATGIATDERPKQRKSTESYRARGASNPSRLTPRELQIAQQVADGLSNRLVAERLVLSERTVEAHLANIFAKLDVNSRVQLATLAARGELL